jgi:hypothetical protein
VWMAMGRTVGSFLSSQSESGVTAYVAGSGDHLLPKIRLKKPRLFPLSTSSNFDCKERVGAEQFSYHKGVRDGFSSGKYIGVSHILRTLRLGI